MFWNKICGFIAIFFISSFNSYAQEAIIAKTQALKTSPIQSTKVVFNTLNKEIKKEAFFLSRPFAVIPANYYTQHFGIMCKKEWALEKATKIPFRFRLGSLQQCNYLEGKR